MNEGLILCVQGGSANGSIVAAEIIPLRGRRKSRSLALELGKPETIPNVSDGRYVVRLRLPNGGLVARNIEVKDGRGEVTLWLDTSYSPNETAAWGYLLQPARRALSHSGLNALRRKFDSPDVIAGFDSELGFSKASLPPPHSLRQSFRSDLFLQEVRLPDLPSSFIRLDPVPLEDLRWERLTGQYSATADPNVVAEFRGNFDNETMPVLMIADPQ
ncbi:MAG: hypothetical protein KDN05_01270, partial [Verrucomicrobiae bacterium]|nr:hypothetical protein [Verrucomicrobiae bacterium]